jgi:chromosomal replication initiation ATPase DnaA
MTCLSDEITELRIQLPQFVEALRNARLNYEAAKTQLELLTHKKVVYDQAVSDDQKVDSIIRTVSDLSGIPMSTMLSANRHSKVVIARQVAIYLIKENTHLSLGRIGEVISNGKPKNHATIIHSVKAVLDDYWTSKKTNTETERYALAEQSKDLLTANFQI